MQSRKGSNVQQSAKQRSGGFWGKFIKSPIGFTKIGIPGSILTEIHNVRQDLLKGLESKSHAEGWDDPTEKTEQALWTCFEVCRSLLQERVPISNLDTVLEKVEKSKITVDGLKGWASDCIPGAISTYMTSDAGLLYLVSGKFNELREVLDTLKRMQHDDGGWGVCHYDKVSRPKVTGWVLQLYSRCLKYSGAYTLFLLDEKFVEKYNSAIGWLNSAYNEDNGEDDGSGGWGNLSNTLPCSISSTAIALYVLLTTEQALKAHPDFVKRIQIQKRVIKAGLSWLISVGVDDSWVGDTEQFTVIDPKTQDRHLHISGGLGTIFVAQVLAAAARLGYLLPDDPHLISALRNIIRHAKHLGSNQGRWIVPSDSNGSPTAWNSSFALDTFADFETLYLENLRRGYVEFRVVYTSLWKARMWRRISIVLGVLLVLILVFPRLGFLSELVDWFDSQLALTQGVILLVLGAILERVISVVAMILRRIWSPFNHL